MEQILFHLAELKEGECKTLRIKDGLFEKELFVVMANKQFHVYENSCPHTGAPLDWVPDRFLNLEKTHIQCSTHHALFRISDGYCVSGPCAGMSLKKVEVREADGKVILPNQEG